MEIKKKGNPNLKSTTFSSRSWRMKNGKPDVAGRLSIAVMLAQSNLSAWGFVAVRTTYSSQPNWDRFLKTWQDDWREEFATAGLMDVFDKWAFTVLENASTLDKADLYVASKVFLEWAENSDQANSEREGSHCADVENRNLPRYAHFVLGDEEAVQSVVDDERRKNYWDGQGVNVVYWWSVLEHERVMLEMGKSTEIHVEDYGWTRGCMT